MHEFRVMTDPDVEAVHRASLRVLAETGITLNHSEAQDIFTSSGARVENGRV